MVEQTVQPVHVPPGGGDTVFFVGDTYTTLLSGAQTGGAFALLEALVPAHTGPRRTFTARRTRPSSCWTASWTSTLQTTCTEPSPAVWSSSRGESGITSAMPATVSRACSSCTRPPEWKECSRRSARPEVAGGRRRRARQAIWRRLPAWQASTGSRSSATESADRAAALPPRASDALWPLGEVPQYVSRRRGAFARACVARGDSGRVGRCVWRVRQSAGKRRDANDARAKARS
jgi:hypothetical protein